MPIKRDYNYFKASMHHQISIGVIGSGDCSPDICQLAYEVGKGIAQAGAYLVCGGLGGVMEAAAKGAKEAGGVTVGILPGASAQDANPYIDIPIVTDMGHARNVIVVRSSEAVIAVSGSYGTLSEIAFAIKIGIPVVALRTTYHDERMIMAATPEESVYKALEAAKVRSF